MKSINPWQFLAATICVLVNMLDGFDVLIMSVAAPTIGSALGLSTPQVGLVFSAGLAGMMFGALLLSGCADYFGRRVMVLVCVAINVGGMFLTGSSHDLAELLIYRFVTGFGVGGMMPTINTAIAEVVGEKARSSAVVIQAAAYPMGGLLAALAWPLATVSHSWHQVIQGACLPSALCFCLVLMFLPESVPFLLTQSNANALVKANKTLARFGRPLLTQLAGEQSSSPVNPVRIGANRTVWWNVVILAAVTFLAQFSFYFFLSWLPLVMAHSVPGKSVQYSGAVLLNLGGIAGDFIFASLSVWISVRRLTSRTMLLGFLSVVALGLCLNRELITISLAGLVGATLFASMAGIYSIAPAVFPTLNRSAGTGVAFSVGRLGGALSPWLGALIMRLPAVSAGATLLVMASPLIVATVALRFLRKPDSGALLE